MDEIKCKLELVNEKDIPILYEMLKEFYLIPNARIHTTPLPPFEQSRKYIMKYLNDNENHEYHKWYLVIDEKENVLGSVYITKKDYLNYQIFNQYQNRGIGQTAVKLLMKENPRDRYFVIVNQKNERSLKLVKKFGFIPKGTIFEKIIKD